MCQSSNHFPALQQTGARSRVKISIVTLSFNQRVYLKEAIDSVLSQAYPYLEYIVVDPGSHDGSRELITSYDEQIAHVIFEPDRGAADGLNKGFGRATGDVYGFLNADDLLYPGSLDRVVQFFEDHPECDLAMGDGYTIDGRGRRIRHYKAQDFTVPHYFYGGAQWLQQSTFFRADAYRKSSGFNLENRTCWDGELFVKIVHEGARIGYIRADLAGFRIHESSISGSGRMNEQYQKDRRRIFRQVLGHEWGATDDVLQLFYRAEGFLKDRLHLLARKGTE
jgi:glycosyltransferase involved in cell wall biosynthesis